MAKKSAYERVIEACNQYGYTLLSAESECKNLNSKIKYLCPKHGVHEAWAQYLIYGHKCIDCSYEERFDTVRHSNEFVDQVISSYGNEWINKGEYKNCFEHNLRIRCKCGNEYTTAFQNYYKHGVVQCPICSRKASKGEQAIEKYLDSLNIKYEREKRFDGCKDKKRLPFDFYLPDLNVCIEFDGKHHYEKLEGYGDLETTQRHDLIKNNYCMQQGIRLIRIPYYEGSKIEDIISTQLYN